jgi:hypothetical protein
LNQFFKAKTGLTLGRDDDHQVLFVDFVDRINIEQKVSYMGSITDVEHLKNYFYYSLRSLRKSPLYTEDYELDLEKAYDKRLSEIVDLMLEQAKKQMALLTDFKEIHHLITDLMNRSLEIGFSHEQVNTLNDLYELKKDSLRREKLDEIHSTLETMSELTELTEYWDSIKWYLFNNRPYLGMEFETLIAKRFDETRQRLRH